MEKAAVYFTKEITPDSLIRIYKALGVELKGKVGVKISTGEPGGNNYLHPELIGGLVHALNGTIIECCTAYEGRRMDPKEHWKATVSYTHLFAAVHRGGAYLPAVLHGAHQTPAGGGEEAERLWITKEVDPCWK